MNYENDPQMRERTGEASPSPENEPRPNPRIYVASLSDYNHGRLHGAWIDADAEEADLHDGIQRMLAASSMPRAEEWAIHDFEGFGAFRVSEYEAISTVARMGRGIAEHGTAFSLWAEHVGTLDESMLDAFEDHYLGSWKSLSEYAEQLVDELGEDPIRSASSWLQPFVHIDYQSLGEVLGSELYVSGHNGYVHLFQP